jgi:predicted nucleic acid-binding protein
MLVDTAGLLCFFDRDNEHHVDAIQLLEDATVRVIHSYVLVEFVALCHARRLNRAGALALTAECMDNPAIECVWVDEFLHRDAQTLLESRTDKNYSLCDAVSFLLMQRRGLNDALTTDHHFEQEGFVKLL